MVKRKSYLFLSFLGLITSVSACGPRSLDISAPPISKKDEWLISGSLTDPHFANGELIALSLDGTRYRTKIGTDRSFGIELPGSNTYAVYFVPPVIEKKPDPFSVSDFIKGNPETAAGLEALLSYEDSQEIRDTLRLPAVIFDHTLSLGEIDIKDSYAFPTSNPANTLDFDSDGLNDYADPDDQNDGLNDREQRLQTERIEVCHYSKGKGALQSIPLPDLLHHLNHGDNLGQCKSRYPGDGRMPGVNIHEAPIAPVPLPPLPETIVPEIVSPIRTTDPIVNEPVVVEITSEESRNDSVAPPSTELPPVSSPETPSPEETVEETEAEPPATEARPPRKPRGPRTRPERAPARPEENEPRDPQNEESESGRFQEARDDSPPPRNRQPGRIEE